MANRYIDTKDLKSHMSHKDKLARQDAMKAMDQYTPLDASTPSWLDDTAALEWERIIPLLTDNLPVSALDLATVANYCQLYSDVQAAQAEIDQHGRMVKTTTGGKKINPAVKLRNDAGAQMEKLSRDLGLTPYARLNFNVKGQGQSVPDPLAELLNDD